MEQTEVIAVLECLASSHRLAVFRLLVRRGGSGMVAGDLARAVGVSPAALSFHLRGLLQAGLVVQAHEGRFHRYRADTCVMRELMDFLTDQCCREDDPTGTVCTAGRRRAAGVARRGREPH